MNPNLIGLFPMAEVDYRRERVARSYSALRRDHDGATHRRFRRRPRLEVVAPYGDVRA